MSYCTAINCMDGRVQLPTTAFQKERFNVDHVDMITEAGPNRQQDDGFTICVVKVGHRNDVYG
jgi:hypothetical protein